MLVNIRRLGNSHGILIPKPVLKQVGLSDQVDMQVEGNALVLRKPSAPPRSGWAEASKRIAALGDDGLVLPDFGNEVDSELTW
jgi:antitoxin MazE